MKGIKYVDVKYECIAVEPYLEKVKKRLLFNGDFFGDCETIEECRDKFYTNYHGEDRITYIEFRTYKSKEDLENKKFDEYIGE
mgnify:CR=1 FL=1